MPLPDPLALFERHLDLRPLRGRARGLVRCRFHEDTRPSLSVDVEQGLFHCFGCGAQGGVKAFLELVGEAQPDRDRRPAEPVAWLDLALPIALDRMRRYGRWAPWFYSNGMVWLHHHTVDEARRAAVTLGEDHPRTWILLELAARAEREAHLMEMDLDALLAGGRLHLDDVERVALTMTRRT